MFIRKANYMFLQGILKIESWKEFQKNLEKNRFYLLLKKVKLIINLEPKEMKALLENLTWIQPIIRELQKIKTTKKLLLPTKIRYLKKKTYIK